MEIIKRDNLPDPLKARTAGPGKTTARSDVKLSLYMPCYRSAPAKRWRQAHKLLEQARRFLSLGVAPEELERMLGLLKTQLESEEAVARHPKALGFAYFLDAENFEIQELLTPCEPLVVVAASFHVVPLLRSFASEPHYRMVVIEQAAAAIYRRDHSGLKAELKVAFPTDAAVPAAVLYPKVTARDLSRIWQNVSDFSHALLNLQSLDPRPLALIGEDRLRRVLIEDIRASLTRPVFFQDRLAHEATRTAVDELAAKADEAFTNRVAHQPPFDVAALIDDARRGGRYSGDLTAIFEAAQAGQVERLFVTSTARQWGVPKPDGSGLELHAAQANHKDDCLIDDTVEAVLKGNGSVLFMEHEEAPDTVAGTGIGAILIAVPGHHLTH